MAPATTMQPNILAKIYADKLMPFGHGHPLWRPEPASYSYGTTEVMIGDVGYLHNGGFYRIFNTTLSKGHPTNSSCAPDGFEKLKFDEGDVRKEENYIIRGLLASKGVMHASVPENLKTPGITKYTLYSGEKNSAFLVTLYNSTKESAIPLRRFASYMKRYHSQWRALTSSALEFDIAADDIIFVTGHVKTPTWLVSVLSNYGASITLEKFTPKGQSDTFALINPCASNVHMRCGPGPVAAAEQSQDTSSRSEPAQTETNASDSQADKAEDACTQVEDDQRSEDTKFDTPQPPKSSSHTLTKATPPLPSNQCVFLSYYRMKHRILLPTKIKAAAEPDDHGGFSDSNGQKLVQLECLQPLDDLLNYILETTDANAALASTDDVYALAEGYDWPSDFAAFLRATSPLVVIDDCAVGTVFLTKLTSRVTPVASKANRSQSRVTRLPACSSSVIPISCSPASTIHMNIPHTLLLYSSH